MSILAKKSFGQHWLKSKAIVKRIVEAAEISPQDCVLEIGPGKGILTQALLEKTKSVTAVEADRDLVPHLKKKFGEQINLVQGDVLKQTNTKLVETCPCSLKKTCEKRYKFVANLPYNVASAVIAKFLVEEPRPSRMVVMVQREVADRITAKPPQMGLFSVVCQLYADVKKVCHVKPGSFSPPPKVNSTVLQFDLAPLSKKRVRPLETEAIIRLAKAGFRNRRKQLHRNLADAKIVSSERTKQILTKMKLSETARAQELTLKNWITLFQAISKLK